MTTAVRALGRRFLLWCANEHNDFRISEITSIANVLKVKLDWIEKNDQKPYVLVDVDSEEDIKNIMSRTMLVRSAYELWAQATNHDELHKQLKLIPKEFLSQYCKPNLSFRIRVETFCKTLSLKEKLKKIEQFEYLPMEGAVKLENPNIALTLLEFYGLDPNAIPELPYKVFFGRWICNGQRHNICKLHLKGRKFIGNTSMDAQLSLIMANQALVVENSLVYDPFVGTGSLLVAAAHFGGYILGADIDYLMLHGKAKPTRVTQTKREHDESVAANLSQYGHMSHYLDVVIADSSLPIWRNFILDAIITDPPYGIREATEKIGSSKSYTIKDEHVRNHIPSKVSYNLQDIYKDLLNFAASHLKRRGRLVYWFPVFVETYSEKCIPEHPCLTLLSNSEQKLSKHTSRRLITMEKTREPSADEVNDANVSNEASSFAKNYFRSIANNNQLKKLANKNAPRTKKD